MIQQLQIQLQKETTKILLWFNPFYSETVKTKIGKIFLQLIKKYFPKGHNLTKFRSEKSKKSVNFFDVEISLINQHLEADPY